MSTRSFNYRCVDCGAPNSNGHPMTQRCKPCAANFYEHLTRANRAVQREIAHGRMQKAAALTCVDCGGQARDWDHRDYSKPLQVEPVCRACNFKRGPALYPKLTEQAAA